MSGWLIQLYKEAIEEWVKSSLRLDCIQQQNFGNFHEKIFQNLGIYVSYDLYISQAIVQILKFSKYQTFDLMNNINIKRIIIFKIAEYLFMKKMISKKDFLFINLKKNQCYLHSINIFFLKIQQLKGKLDMNKLWILWQSIVQIKLYQFWQWAKNHQIRHQILVKIYQISINLQLDHKIEASSYFQAIKKKYQNNYHKISKIQIPLKLSSKDQKLIQIAKVHSLYLNPDFKNIIQQINHFKIYLQNLFFKTNNQKYLYFFGSLANKLAIFNSYDLDLNVSNQFAHQQLQDHHTKKQRDYDQLQSYKQKIQSQTIKWYKNLYIQRKLLPFALLKIEVNQQFRQMFEIPQLKKIEIVIQNRNAMINSRLIAEYTKHQQILIFCLIVKLWAKKMNIINQRNPMAGLSSYAIILMSIYYLMVTQQINYIRKSQNIIIEKVQNCFSEVVQFCNIRHPYTNFQNFLLFYSKNSLFIRQKKMICLIDPSLCKCQSFYDQKIIFNIYDFIDNYNRGRLTTDYAQLIFKLFDDSLIKLQEPYGLSDLFKITWSSRGQQKEDQSTNSL